MQNKARIKEKITNPKPIPDIVLFGFPGQTSMGINQWKRRVVRSKTPTIAATVEQNNAPSNILSFFCLDLESRASELDGFQMKNEEERISPVKQAYITHAILLLILFSTLLYPSYPELLIPHDICFSIF